MDEPKQIGDWLLICVLGSGAFGKVDLWRNRINEEEIAVKKCKFLLPGRLTKRQRVRWINEVEIMKSLNHENVIAYKELPIDLKTAMEQYNPTNLPILSMEYCAKGNLRKFLAQTKNIKGCDEADVRCILRDVANAIAYLHDRKITHRDIKPENIVIRGGSDRELDKNVYKLIDLGYAKELDTIASFVGTVPYLAPEIFYTQPYTNSVDYWSLGILTYEIVTGSHPFLPTKTPVERFNYLKEKSDEDISISISRDGRVQFSPEILPYNRLSPVFKRHLENWLRLLLAYDSKKRGFRGGVKMDVFQELDALLEKTLLKVFSVFNYRSFVYEIEEDTRLRDIKMLIETDTSIPVDLQMFVVDDRTVILEDHIDMNEFYQAHPEKTLYVFKKRNDFEERIVNLPAPVQALLQSQQIPVESILRTLYTHAICFIDDERRLIEQFDTALTLQIHHLIFFFDKIKTLYSRTRANTIKLNTQIDCYGDCSGWQNGRWSRESEDYLLYLTKYRKFLRQTKELTENFNSLTAKFRDVLKMEKITSHAENLRKALQSTEVDMTQKYDKATTLHNRIGSSDNSTTEMIQILLVVLKIPSKAIFLNNDLKTFLRSALSAQRKLQKLLVWCEAINDQITQISSSLQDCQKEKYRILGSVRIRLPINVEDEAMETDELVSQNRDLRYRMQDISSQVSTYLRNTKEDTICVWNGVILPSIQNK